LKHYDADAGGDDDANATLGDIERRLNDIEATLERHSVDITTLASKAKHP
jgi:hypothetical protein